MNAFRSTDLLGLAIWLILLFGTWFISYSRSRAQA
jgi:hypothetical protein